MTMTATITQVDGFKFVGTTGRGHSLVMHPGEDSTAPSPMDYIVLGVGGCASVDIVDGLKKNRQSLYKLSTSVTANRVDAIPGVFETLNVCFHVHGRNIDEGILKQIVADSHAKNCSAAAMLINGGVAVTFSYELDNVTN